MFTVELALKQTAVLLSVQKKSEEEAKALYESIVKTLNGGTSVLIQVECDQQPHKQISALASEVAAVQIYEKTGTATASGRPPGFFALTAEPDSSAS
ncbi:hypothetical protein C7271_09680 [filamentous cyanobacterium CCP5]|nr:hypothetical protein C7271_09680 [filamentous cyanobacterium CCP5]